MSRPTAINKIVVLDADPSEYNEHYGNSPNYQDPWDVCMVKCRFIALQVLFLPSIIMKNNVLLVLNTVDAEACKLNYLLEYHIRTIYPDLGLYITAIILMQYQSCLIYRWRRLAVYVVFVASSIRFTFDIINTWKTHGINYGGIRPLLNITDIENPVYLSPCTDKIYNINYLSFCCFRYELFILLTCLGIIGLLICGILFTCICRPFLN